MTAVVIAYLAGMSTLPALYAGYCIASSTVEYWRHAEHYHEQGVTLTVAGRPIWWLIRKLKGLS
jgi:hypothetical protein